MQGDVYLKLILTVLALEMLWLGLAQTSSNVSAQAQPTRVIITGIELEGSERDFLPVGVAGGFREVPQPYRGDLEPLGVRVLGTVPVEVRAPLKIEADRPLKIEADKPLPVESVPYTPGARPGE